MPFTAMADYVDGLQDLKLFNNGVPLSYPLALNGLGCGPDCNCSCNKGVSGLGIAPLTDQTERFAKGDDFTGSYKLPTDQSYSKISAAPSMSASSGNKPVDIVNALMAPFLPLINKIGSGGGKRRPQVVNEAPDFLTPSLIIGGSLVAGLLLIALSKGKRRD